MFRLCSPLSVCLFYRGFGRSQINTTTSSPSFLRGLLNLNETQEVKSFLLGEDCSSFNERNSSESINRNEFINHILNRSKSENDLNLDLVSELDLDLDLDLDVASQRAIDIATQCANTSGSEPGLFWLEYVSICVLGYVLVVVGICGNTLSLVVLSRTRVGNVTSNILLMALAVTDIVVLVSFLTRFAACFTCYLDTPTSITLNTHIMMYGGISSVVSAFHSVNVTAVIALERAVSVFFPFKVTAIFNKKTVKLILLALLAVPLGVVTPFLILARVTWSFDPRFNVTVATGYSFLGDYAPFHTALGVVENLNLIAAMTLVLVCGSSTAIKIRRTSNARQTMTTSRASVARNSESTQEQKAIKMLLVIVLFSFIGNIPNISLNVLFYFKTDYIIETGLFCYIQVVASMFIVVNSSSNFLIYFVMSSKFKRACSDIFRNAKFCQRMRRYWKKKHAVRIG